MRHVRRFRALILAVVFMALFAGGVVLGVMQSGSTDHPAPKPSASVSSPAAPVPPSEPTGYPDSMSDWRDNFAASFEGQTVFGAQRPYGDACGLAVDTQTIMDTPALIPPFERAEFVQALTHLQVGFSAICNGHPEVGNPQIQIADAILNDWTVGARVDGVLVP